MKPSFTSGRTFLTGLLTDDSSRPPLGRLRKKYFPVDSLTSAAKAGTENKPAIALKRCATPNQTLG